VVYLYGVHVFRFVQAWGCTNQYLGRSGAWINAVAIIVCQRLAEFIQAVSIDRIDDAVVVDSSRVRTQSQIVTYRDIEHDIP